VSGFRLGTQHQHGTIIVVTGAGLLLAGSVAVTFVDGLEQPVPALWFGLFVLLGEVLRVTLPGDREAAPLAMAAALGYALLGSYGGVPTKHPITQVVAVVGVAVLLGAIPHAAAGRQPRLEDMARRVLVVAFAATLFQAIVAAVNRPEHLEAGWQPWQKALVMVVVVSVTLLADAVLAALVLAGDQHAPFRAAFRDEVRALRGISSAIGASGMLIALAAQAMAVWALPVFAVPIMLTQFAFRRYASIRETYHQTVRSLSRLTEVAGYTETGHASRVAELAVAVGRDLGMTEPGLTELQFAALVHDLGQLSLREPIPGGATVIVSRPEQRQIAQLGADVIRQTGVMDGVATIVERQAEPYRRGALLADSWVPLGSRIIKAVNAYDDIVGESRRPERQLEALERLRLGVAYEFDPRVVDSLSRVLDRLRGSDRI
jgi:HD-GYP domain-containing protein (c-di-GMP phosphodiesterase class II)